MSTSRLLLLLVGALAQPALVRAADYAPAATALIDWTPNTTNGVGVPGGIPARTTIYTTITTTGDSTDRAAEIHAAVSACPAGQTVLLGPGTFYVTNLSFNHAGWAGYAAIGNRTLRGSGSDPATGTVIRLTGSGGVRLWGSEIYGGPYSGTVTGSPVKGDTTLTITGASDLSAGMLVELATEDDDTLPILHVSGYRKNKRQLIMLTAVNTGAGTITFQPALYQTPVKRTGGALAMTWQAHASASAALVGAGIEDMTVDNTYGSALITVSLSGAHGSWMKNIRVRGSTNYGMGFGESCQSEMRDCWIEESRDPGWFGSNHAGISIGMISGCLIENNIFTKNLPIFEVQGSPMSGCVIAYNFGLQYIDTIAVNASHAAGNHCNLWEGNSFTNLRVDGYFGSASDDVIFRNDLHGRVATTAEYSLALILPRFTRRYEVVGNQIARPGASEVATELIGVRTAFNWTGVGEANNYEGDPQIDLLLTGTLTTRTSDTEGVFTMDTTVGSLETGQGVMSVLWGTTSGRFGMVVTDVTGLVVTLTGGGSDVLPTASTTIRIYPGPNGFLETDNAVAQSSIFLGNNYGTTNSIPAGQALGSTTLPASLFRSSAPSFMSGYNWPPYDPVTPDRRFAAIPAGARYEGVSGTPAYNPARLGPMGARRR